jgi:hypothetical protein
LHAKNTGNDDAAQDESRAYRVRLPGFIADDEVGLGDVITHVTHTFGITLCGGCGRRGAMLNRWLVFTGHAKSTNRS